MHTVGTYSAPRRRWRRGGARGADRHHGGYGGRAGEEGRQGERCGGGHRGTSRLGVRELNAGGDLERPSLVALQRPAAALAARPGQRRRQASRWLQREDRRGGVARVSAAAAAIAGQAEGEQAIWSGPVW